MAMTTPQSNGVNEEKQSLCMALKILVHFFAVLCKVTTWNEQIWAVFSGEREHSTVNSAFSFLTWTQL